MVKSSKKNKLNIDLIKNGIIFNKQESSSASKPTSQSTPKPKSVNAPGETEAGKKESPVQKSDKAKAKVVERNESLEEHVDIPFDFEPTTVSSPIIQERKDRRDEPVKDMEDFLEKVPTPKKEETGIIYEPIDENYLRSYESTYQGRKWDEERTVHEIRENLQRFENPGRFREITEIQDPAITKHVFREQVKYDLERIDTIDNQRSVFKPAFDRKYKARGKL